MAQVKPNTKQKLIDTAMNLIWQSGYSCVSVDDICKAADVRKGSFYHYFPSKVDLALAAMDAHYAIMTPVFDEVFSPLHSPRERFERLADLAYEHQKEVQQKFGKVCGCPFATLGSELAGQQDEITEKVQNVFNCHEKYYKSAIRDFIAEGALPPETDLDEKSKDLYSYILGQMMVARINNTLDPVRSLKRGILNIIGVDASPDVQGRVA